MRITFQVLTGTWLLSLGAAVGLNYARHSMTADASAQAVSRREIASIATPLSNFMGATALSKNFCNQAENYTCEWRVFGPQASDSSSIVRECVAIRDNRKPMCLQILKISFQAAPAMVASSETSVASSTSDAASSAPVSTVAAMTEMSEVKCTMRGTKSRAVLESDGGTLAVAVQGLMAKCEELASGIQ